MSFRTFAGSPHPCTPSLTMPIKVGIIGGSGLDDPDILTDRAETTVSTIYGAVHMRTHERTHTHPHTHTHTLSLSPSLLPSYDRIKHLLSVHVCCVCVINHVHCVCACGIPLCVCALTLVCESVGAHACTPVGRTSAHRRRQALTLTFSPCLHPLRATAIRCAHLW